MSQKDQVIGQLFFESDATENRIRSIQQVSSNKVRMICILQDADVPNRNGRVYPKTVINEALKSAFIAEKLATKSLAGEMNHPESGSSLARQMTIDMRNISHFIKRIWWDEKEPNVLLGEIETAGNTIGKDFAGLILENDMVCSFSMRGGGDVTRKNGFDYVKSPLKIITWDAVHFPSHKRAYMQQRLAESSSLPVTVGMLTEYVARESENFSILSESLQCFTKDALDLAINDGKITISEKASGKMLGYSNIENKLKLEYADALRNLYI